MERKNPKYLAWIRTLECIRCEAPPPNDPHHIIGVGEFSGMGLKPPDVLAMPLCRRCHGLVHEHPQIWPEQFHWIVMTWLYAIEEGIIEVAP